MDFYTQYCTKPDICWQLDMAVQENFKEEEMLAVCLKCIYYKENKK